MAKSDYLDPHWQRFRLERLNLSDWSCDICSSADETLHVHHPFYIAGRKPWQYPMEITQALCSECHDVAHDFLSDFDKLGPESWEIILEKIFRLRKICGPSSIGEMTVVLNDIFCPAP